MAKKAASNKAASDNPNKSFQQGRSTEKAGVGTPESGATVGIPDEVKIKRPSLADQGTEISSSAKVKGNQALVVIDIAQSRPVEVFLIETKQFAPEAPEQPLVFVQGAVSNDLMPAAQARSKFAIKEDGTVIYNARGFDDVPATAEFDMVDIVALIEFNHGKGATQREKARKEEAAARQKEATANAKAAKEAAADDK